MSNFEIRRKSRENLGESLFSQKWLYVVLAVVIISVITSVFNVNFSQTTNEGEAQSISTASYVSPLSACMIFLEGVLSLGMAAVVLRCARSSEVLLGDLLTGFKDGRFGKTFVLGILRDLYVFLWALLFLIPGIIKTYSYSMCYFISLDHPEYSAKECIKKSEEMMNGQKGKLFLLDLSFLGWYIVGILCLGVGILWVNAYQHEARAVFYDSLVYQQDYEEV